MSCSDGRGATTTCQNTSAAPALPPTAIVMPIYNEDPHIVFANLHAIVKSLDETGCSGAFSVFVLSDTTNPDVWLEEEHAWAKMVAELPSDVASLLPPSHGKQES